MTPPDKRNAWRDARVAGEYDERRFRTPLQRLKHRRDEALLLRLLRRDDSVRSVLDLPTGTGRMLAPLARAGYEVIGVDVSAEMMAAANGGSGAGAPLVQADCLHLPLTDSAVDAVVSLRFLFHLREPGARLAALREMARTSGRVVVGQVRYRWTLKHAGRWLRSRVGLCPRYRPSRDRTAIAGELEQAGLRLVELRTVSRLFSDKALFLARLC